MLKPTMTMSLLLGLLLWCMNEMTERLELLVESYLKLS